MLRLTVLLGAVALCSAQDSVCLFYGSGESGMTEQIAECRSAFSALEGQISFWRKRRGAWLAGSSFRRVVSYISSKTGLQPIPIGLIANHEAGPDLFKSCDHYIIGAPTLNAEAETGKTGTDWDPFLQGTFKQMGSLKGKTFAVFGLGDQSKYPWHFCDAMDEMARAFIDAGARLLGAWVQQEDEDGLPSYYYEGSKAAWEGPPLFGKFVGLALDDVNQRSKTGERVREWLDQLRFEGMPIGTATCEERRRSRSLQAVAATEASWYSAWRERLGCWWMGLPVMSQSQFGACMGALGLHVGSRFDQAFGRMGAPPATDGTQLREGRCDWIKEGAPEMQGFPELPAKGDFQFRIPPIPRLMPNGAFQNLLSVYEGGSQRYASKSAGPLAYGPIMAGGLAGGAAAVTMLAGMTYFSKRYGRVTARLSV